MLLWSFIHQYYEALLWQVSIRTGYLITDLPLGLPGINLQDKLFCCIGDLIFIPNTGWYTVCTITAIPLLLAPSGIRWDKRLEMIFIGVFIIFVFQVLCVYIGMYGWLYLHYPKWLSDESKNVFEIITYQEIHARIVLWLNHFFKVFFRHIITIGVSIGLLCFYKKGNADSFVKKIL